MSLSSLMKSSSLLGHFYVASNLGLSSLQSASTILHPSNLQRLVRCLAVDTSRNTKTIHTKKNCDNSHTQLHPPASRNTHQACLKQEQQQVQVQFQPFHQQQSSVLHYVDRLGKKVDEKELGFEYYETNGVVIANYKNGAWSDLSFQHDFSVKIPLASTALNYGQSIFEGLKAWAGPDDQVRLFRPHHHGLRMQSSAHRLAMPLIPEELFVQACIMAVQKNIEFVPRFQHGQVPSRSLYLRPMLFGTDKRLGVFPGNEFLFAVYACPVGSYHKSKTKPASAVIMDQFDRVASLGTGQAKMAGNYAADLYPLRLTRERGHTINLYLDPKTHTHIEEFGYSNFVAIKDNSYITPDSQSILKSVTNDSLMVIARDLHGLTVERRPVPVTEISEFDEVAACGTAVIVTPIQDFIRGDQVIHLRGKHAKECKSPILSRLASSLRGIMTGQTEDSYNWTVDCL